MIKKRLLISEITAEEKLYAEKLYRQYARAIFLYSCTQVKQKEVARDITQNVFVKWLVRAINNPGFRDAAAVRAFLFTLAHNECIDFLRHQKVERNNGSQIAERWDTTPTEAEQENMDNAIKALEWAHRLISELPPDRRDAAFMSLVEGRSNADVSAILGIEYHKIRYTRDTLINKLRDIFRDKNNL